MAKPWIPNIKDTDKLTIYNDLGGKWASIFHLALEEFNKLGLSVKMSKEKDENQANVVMKTAGKMAHYTYDNQDFTHSFSGTALHGYTMLMDAGVGIKKAVVFLPESPQTSGGFIHGKQIVEKAGKDAMLVIAVHELIHACGLENNDHADNGVFYSPLSISGKKLIVPEVNKNNKQMPPIFISPATVCKVQILWT